MNLFRRRIHCLRPSLPLQFNLTPAFAFSTSRSQSSSSPPNPHFASDYLARSCGLSSDQALKASVSIQHLKSPDKPDAVLHFLREIGVSESDMRTAVSREARILCSSLEKNWRPNVAKLREVGCSTKYISHILSRRPHLFRYNFAPKVDFWMRALGSAEFLSMTLRGDVSLFCRSLEKVLIPNLSFLKEQCGLSPRQIVRLIRSSPRSITCRPEVLKMLAERAEGLGVARSSGTFLYALIIVGYLKQGTIDARLNNFISNGLSQEEVAIMVSKVPVVLNASEEVVGRKMKFLIKEAGCDKIEMVRNPFLLTLSLENRLIPRNAVRELLRSKGLLVANLKFATFLKPTDEKFVAKFIQPFEHAIPGLHQAYADARKIRGGD